MKPWQQEALRHAGRRPKPICQCCDQPVETELWLDLSPFGINGVGCERCVYRHFKQTEEMNDV
jgi:hypothetical protein